LEGSGRTRRISGATNPGKSTEDNGVSDDVLQPENLRGILAPQQKSGRVHTTYLVATALATIGWIWFIAWCALQLI